MPEKSMEIADLKTHLRDGLKLALGGQSISMNPVALVRQVLLAGSRELQLVVSPVGGFAADLLIGAGAVQSIEFAQMGLWEHGLAPNLRRYAQEGRITCIEHT